MDDGPGQGVGIGDEQTGREGDQHPGNDQSPVARSEGGGEVGEDERGEGADQQDAPRDARGKCGEHRRANGVNQGENCDQQPGCTHTDRQFLGDCRQDSRDHEALGANREGPECQGEERSRPGPMQPFNDRIDSAAQTVCALLDQSYGGLRHRCFPVALMAQERWGGAPWSEDVDFG